jgi:hypothetical protein
MTVRELRAALQRYPDEAIVPVVVGTDTVYVDGVANAVEFVQHVAQVPFSDPDARTPTLHALSQTLIHELEVFDEGVVYLEICGY